MQSALLATALLSILTLVIFIVSQSRLEQEFGVQGQDIAFQIAMALLAAGGGCIVLASVISRHLRRVYGAFEEEIRVKTRALEEQSEKDRTILESIHHGILVIDASGMVVDINPQADRMLKPAKNSLLKMPVEKAFPLMRHNELLSEKEHPVRKCLHTSAAESSVSTENISLRSHDGTIIPIMMTVSPIHTKEELTGAIVIFRDATEERRIDYLKSDFISLASHQLRTPLSTIGWYIELMMNEKERMSLEQVENLHQMASATERMVHVIDALLRVVNLEEETMTPKLQEVDLGKFLQEACTELQVLAKEHKITSQCLLPKTSLHIHVDPVLLRIILENFFNNAVEYTKEGGEITLSAEENDTSIRISLTDTGIGIPLTEQERIFQKMFRGSNANTMRTTGSGLGLYISKMIAESLDGDISFKSEEGKGSTFTVSLPKRGK